MWYSIVCVMLIALDQATKSWAVDWLKARQSVEIFSGFLNFTYLENRGAAFGLLQGQKIFFSVVTFLIVGVMILYLQKNKGKRALNIVGMLIIAGAIGNLIDRIMRGYVVDFIDFRGIWIYVFNVADIYVVCGTIWMAILLLTEKEEETKLISGERKEK